MKIGRNYFALIAEGHTPANTGGLVDLTPSYIVEKTELKSALFVAPAAGTPGEFEVTFGGAYVAGDLVRLTVTSNLVSRQLYRKSYSYEVQAGDTVTDIAAYFANAISKEVGSLNSPYSSATSALGVLTVVQEDDDKQGLIVYDYTDSAAGTIAVVSTPTVISEGQPSDLIDRGIAADDINLASYDTVRIALEADAAIPFIDSVGATAREIYWYGTPGEGGPLATLINT
jgi:hypothetical protein